MTKKALIFSNILLLLVLAFLGVRHLIFKVKHRPATMNKSQSFPAEKMTVCECSYPLEYFDFHYRKETASPMIIMLGNSLIRHGNWDSLLNRKDVINRGISGDRLCCILQRTKYLKNLGAKICFIEGGINDLPKKSTEELAGYFKKLIDFSVQENMKPVINCLFYISPKAGVKYPSRVDYKAINDSIYKLNNKLKVLATEKRIQYIDLNPKISDTTSKVLLDEYTTDGVHFKPTAYELWAKKIRGILAKDRI